jgi:hypothetical protein
VSKIDGAELHTVVIMGIVESIQVRALVDFDLDIFRNDLRKDEVLSHL